MDEYILGENRVPAGLYRIAHDEDGTRKVISDDPAKEDSKPKAAPKAAESPEDDETYSDAPKKVDDKEKSESCTCNTNRVD